MTSSHVIVLVYGTFQVRRDVLLARAWRAGDFAKAGELCADKSERHIVAEQLQMVRTARVPGLVQASRFIFLDQRSGACFVSVDLDRIEEIRKLNGASQLRRSLQSFVHFLFLIFSNTSLCMVGLCSKAFSVRRLRFSLAAHQAMKDDDQKLASILIERLEVLDSCRMDLTQDVGAYQKDLDADEWYLRDRRRSQGTG